MKHSLAERITVCRRRLAEAKPRSYLRIKIELQLRDLMLQELRKENRMDRRRAA